MPPYLSWTVFLLLPLLFSACGAPAPSRPKPLDDTPAKVIDAGTKKAAVSRAELKLDTHGHTARITDIIVTKGGEIITSSLDKSIRIYDAASGREKRKILGSIGPGPEGMINAVALSPDGTMLAAGGFLTFNREGEQYIRIYDYRSGKLLKLLVSHTGIVTDLDFSPDGRYLVSGSGDESIKIWDVTDGFALIDTVRVHRHTVFSVKVVRLDGKDYVLSTSDGGNRIVKYDITAKKTVRTYTADHALKYLAYSKGRIAAAGAKPEILVFDEDLHLLKKIRNNTYPAALAYSPDGRYLLAGAATFPANVNAFDTENGYRKISSFIRFDNMVFRVGFVDAVTAVAGGGDNHELYLWDVRSGRVRTHIAGEGKAIWSVGIRNRTIAWGTVPDGTHRANDFGTLQKSMNLDTFDIRYLRSPLSPSGTLPLENGPYRLVLPKNGDKSTLLVEKNGTVVARIVKGPNNGHVHRCFGWYRDFIVSGGINGSLTIWNKKGVHLATLLGHTGVVWSIALDGDTLISGSDDQSMLLWDLGNIRPLQGEPKIDMENVRSYMRQLHATKEDVIRASVQAGSDEIFVGSRVKPFLRIFVNRKNEYVVWTDDGFFDASRRGSEFIGYQIDRGIYRTSEYISVDALYQTFYRPDLIRKALDGESLTQYAERINIDRLLKDGLPPKVRILTAAAVSGDGDLPLRLQVCPEDGGGFDNLTLMINGTPVSILDRSSRGLRRRSQADPNGCFTFRHAVSLAAGRNLIGFKATNRAGSIESRPAFLDVTYRPEKPIRQPSRETVQASAVQAPRDLHILLIAVNRYRDENLRLRYSVRDADGMLETVKAAARPFFRHIRTYTLFDENVTRDNVRKAFENIRSNRDDVFLLYLAGHGLTDEFNGNYYFLPYDFDPKKGLDRLEENAIGHRTFLLGLSKVAALKSLILLDTCESGSFVDASLQKTTVNRLSKATGRATISASSRTQMALEGYKGHGAFTYTLMEALQGKAYGPDRRVTVLELSDYVRKTLPERTYRTWGYRQIPQSSLFGTDFILGGTR